MRYQSRVLVASLLLVSAVFTALFVTFQDTAPAQAAVTINVNTTNDELNNDGDCSLREAIARVNGTGGDACAAGTAPYTIVLPAGIFRLTIPGTGENANATGDFDITAATTVIIQGAGQGVTFIEGGASTATGLDRVFHITNANANVTFRTLTIRYGREGVEGGGIFNAGTLTLDSVSMTDNTATTRGGAISTTGPITSITNSTFTNNTAASTGGAIHATTRIIGSIINTTFTNNRCTSTSQGQGGAIYLSSTSGITLLDLSTFTSNQANVFPALSDTGGGGAIFNAGTITTISNSTFNTNRSRHGGAIRNDRGTITTISNSVFDGNNTNNTGGAIRNHAGTINLIRDTIIRNNVASLHGGGIATSSLSSRQGRTMRVENVTFTNNSVLATGGEGGAYYIGFQGYGDLIINSTFSNNRANNTNQWGGGGAIYVSSGTLNRIESSTFSGNTARHGGAIRVETNGRLNTVLNSTFNNNTGNTAGGAIFLNSSTLGDIIGTTFNANVVPLHGAALINSGTSTITSVQGSVFTNNNSTGTGSGNGGGITNDQSATITAIYDTRFTGNIAWRGGGVDNIGRIITFRNSLFENNSARRNGAGLSNWGGTIDNLVNVTFSGNQTTSASGTPATNGGAIHNTRNTTLGINGRLLNVNYITAINNRTSAIGTGDVIWMDQGQVTINNSILTTPGNQTDCVITGGTFNGANNLIDGGDGSCAAISVNTIALGTDVSATLADNGGPTRTHALLDYIGHPAVDQSGGCAAVPVSGVDQRYGARDAACDIGAYEMLIKVSPAASAIIPEGGFTTFTISLNQIPTGNVVVPLTSSDGTECLPEQSSVILNASNWTGLTVVILGLLDGIVDGPQPCTIQTGLSTSTDPLFNSVSPRDVPITVDDVTIPNVMVSPISNATSEDGTTATFSVRLATQPTAPVSMTLTVTNPDEGIISIGILTFDPVGGNQWDIPQIITVTGEDDTVVDGDITYRIDLNPVTSADAAYNGINPPDVWVTNLDNDIAEVVLTPITNNTTEAGVTATFTIVLATQPTAPVTIDIISLDTTEGTVSLPNVTFNPSGPGAWNVPQTITLTGVNDVIADGDIAYQVQVGPITTTDAAYAALPNQFLGTVNEDDDNLGILISPISGDTNESGTTATFTVMLASQPTDNVTIALGSADATEGTVGPASLVFTPSGPGAWNIPQTVTVTGVDDFLVDGDITYNVVVGPVTSTDPTYAAIPPINVPVTNIDNDIAGVQASPISNNTREDGTTATFTVNLTSQPSATVVVQVNSGDLTEGTVSVANLTFDPSGPNAWDIPQTVTVTGVDDPLLDGNITYYVLLGPVTSLDPFYAVIDPADVEVVNEDDDIPAVIVSPESNPTREDGTTATFTVVLNTQPTATVTIPISSLDTTEGTVSVLSLVFEPAGPNAWNIPQTVTITGQDDVLFDGDIIYNIRVDRPLSADGAYAALPRQDFEVINEDNDLAGVTVSPISGDTTEAGGTATFTVVLTVNPNNPVTITIASGDTSEGTVSTAALTFTTGGATAWNIPQTVTVTGVDDFIADGDVPYTILIGPITSINPYYQTIDPPDITLSNIDNDAKGIAVSAISNNTREDATTATFTIVLNSEPTAPVIIDLASSDLSEGTLSTGTVTFDPSGPNAWNIPQTITVTGIDDPFADGNIAYSIVVGPVTGGDTDYTVLDPPDVPVINEDDDVVGVNVSAISGNTNESGTTATFTVVLTSQPSAPVTIDIASGDLTEGTVSVLSLTFDPMGPNAWNIPQTVTVTGVDDFVADGNITYTVNVGPVTSGDAAYAALNPNDVTVTNEDNDTVGITVSAASANTTEAGGTATFTIVLTSEPTADVTIGLLSDDTSEGTIPVASVTFTAGGATAWNIPQTITITGQDDVLADGNILYNILTGPVTSTDAAYAALNPNDVSLFNIDNDTVGIGVSFISGDTTEAGGTATFTVVLNTQPTADVTIAVATSDNSEGTVAIVDLTFNPVGPNPWNVAQTVTVTGADDFVADGDIAYTIILGPVASGDAAYAALDPNDVAIINRDNDTVGVTVSAISGDTTEAGGTATFTVVLTSEPTAPVTISLTSSDLTEGTVAPATLIFNPSGPGIWNVPQTVTVTGMDDFVADGNIAYQIVVDMAAGGDALYNAINPADVNLNNLDNDTVGINVSAASGNTTEAGATATFTVVLTSEPTAPVQIMILSSDATEGTAAPATLTFDPAGANAWNIAQTVTITGVDDFVADGNIPYTIVVGPVISGDAAYAALDPADVNLLNLDNDTVGINVSAISGDTTEAGGTATFTIVLNSEPTAPVTVTVSSSDLSEGTVAPINLTFDPVGANAWNIPQTVTVTGVDDLIVDGNIAYTIIVGPVASADPSYAPLNPPDVNLNNLDNDILGINVSAASGDTTEAGGTATFTIVLTSEPTADVTISLATGDNTEGTVGVPSVTFTPGGATAWNIPQVVTITGVDDAVADGNIAYTIITGPVVSGDPLYAALNPADVNLNNIDNDTAAVIVSAISGNTTEAGGTATFTVVLGTQPTASVTISIASGDLTEGLVAPASLTFDPSGPNAWNIPQTVTVTGVDDAVADGNIAYTINVGPVASADALYAAIDPNDVGVINVDNDTVGVTVSAISGNTTEAGGTATFTIVLNSQPTAAVTIDLVSSDLTEGTVGVASVTFDPVGPNAWNIPQTVTVTGVDDFVADGNIAYTIITGPVTSADAAYAALNPADVNLNNLDNDTVGINVSAASGNTTEAGGTATFTVVLTSEPTAPVTISLASSDLTEGTVAPASLTFDPSGASAWNIPQTVTITGVDDPMADGNIAYTILVGPVASADAAYAALDPNDVALLNADNDTVGISVSPISGDTTEAGGTATFTVVLNTQPTAPVTITLTSSDLTEGTVAPASLTFDPVGANAWNIPQTVTVTGVDDFVDDGDIAYTITVGPIASGDAAYATLPNQTVNLNNIDNDAVGIAISAISGNTSEAGTTATFTIILTSEPSAPVTINLASSDLTEGTVSVGSVTFNPSGAGAWNVAQTITVTGVDDPFVDGNIAYTIITGPVISTDAAYAAINPNDVAVTNTDNDTPGITLTPVSGATNESGTTATFTLVLDTQPTAPVTVTITSSDPSEGTVSLGSVTFDPVGANAWNIPQTITITGVDDFVVDGNIAYDIIIGSTVSADGNYNGLPLQNLPTVNNDNDTAGITVSAVSGNTSEAGTTATFTIVLNSQPTAAVTIDLVSSDLTEGTVGVASVTFDPVGANAWNIPQTVTITGVDDFVVDGNIAYTIITGPVTSGDAVYAAINPNDVNLTNTDNDAVGITVSVISNNTSENGTTATFTIVLTSQPSAPVTISLASSDLTEGTVGVAGVTFDPVGPNAWNIPQTITVTGVDDVIADGNIAYTILTGPVVSGDAAYAALNPNDVALLNADNDTVGVSVSPISGNTTEGGGTATFSVELNTQPTAPVTITLTSSDPTEGTVSTGSLIFNPSGPGAWNIPQTVTVTGVDDAFSDGNITYTITVGPIASGDAAYATLPNQTLTLDNLDNDTVGITVSPISGNTGENGATATFTIVLTSEPTAPVTIDLASSNPAEGTLAITQVTFNPSGANMWNVPQTVTVTGVDDVVPDGNQVYTIVTGPVTSADAAYAAIDPVDVTVTNMDNDTPGFSLSPVSGNTTEGGGTATFTVVLNTQPTGPVTINITSSDPSEGTVSVGSITFDPVGANAWNIPQLITITGVDDVFADGNITYNIVVGPVTSADPVYAALPVQNLPVTNNDNDAPGIAVSPVSNNTTEAGVTATFTVVLNTQPTAPVTVAITSNDTTEGTVSVVALTFDPVGGNQWDIPQTVTLTGVDDPDLDGDIAYTITVGPVTSTDAAYAALPVITVSLVNVDNETTPTPGIGVFDPALSKIGLLVPGELGLPGEVLTWVVTVTNTSAVPGTNIIITDTLRPELRIDNAVTTLGTITISGQTVQLTIPVLNPGEAVEMRIVTTVLSSPEQGFFDNTVTLIADGNTFKSATATVNVIKELPNTGYPPRQ